MDPTAPNDGTPDSTTVEHPAEAAADTPHTDTPQATSTPVRPDSISPNDDPNSYESGLRLAEFTRRSQMREHEARVEREKLLKERAEFERERARVAEDIRLMAIVRSTPELRDKFVNDLAPYIDQMPDDAPNPFETRLKRVEAEMIDRQYETFIRTLATESEAIRQQHGLTSDQIRALGMKAVREGEITPATPVDSLGKVLRRFVRDELYPTAAADGQRALINEINGTTGARSLAPNAAPIPPQSVDVIGMSSEDYADYAAKKLGLTPR